MLNKFNFDIKLGMSQKAFTIIFVIVLVVATIGIAFTKMPLSTTPSSPSPTPGDISFKTAVPMQNNMQNQQTMVAPPPTSTKKTYAQFPGVLADEQLQNKKAVIETNKGTIEFEIYPDVPKAASNFIFLANDGFYDGLTFHRVEKSPTPFVIQGGDPLGNGTGGPGYKFEDEAVTKPYSRGIVAMANSGPNTNGSQFFIMLADTPLPPKYTIFGNVISGMEVVDQITVGDKMNKVTIQPLN